MAETRNSDDLSAVTVSATVLGHIIGVGDRMIRRLAEEGVLKKNSHGKYLLLSSVRNYILTIKVSKAGENTSGALEDSQDFYTEKAKHEHLKRQITDLKLQVLQGKLHKSEDVERVMTDMFVKFKSKMEAMPAKLARKLERKSKTEIQELLQVEIISALQELSEYNPADFCSDECMDINIDEDISDDYLLTLGEETDEENS